MSSELFYTLEEQNQMVRDLCPQSTSAIADRMVRAQVDIYTDARATQAESVKSDCGSHRRLSGREDSQAGF